MDDGVFAGEVLGDAQRLAIGGEKLRLQGAVGVLGVSDGHEILFPAPIGPTRRERNLEQPVAMEAVQKERAVSPHHGLLGVILENGFAAILEAPAVGHVEREQGHHRVNRAGSFPATSIRHELIEKRFGDGLRIPQIAACDAEARDGIAACRVALFQSDFRLGDGLLQFSEFGICFPKAHQCDDQAVADDPEIGCARMAADGLAAEVGGLGVVVACFGKGQPIAPWRWDETVLDRAEGFFGNTGRGAGQGLGGDCLQFGRQGGIHGPFGIGHKKVARHQRGKVRGIAGQCPFTRQRGLEQAPVVGFALRILFLPGRSRHDQGGVTGRAHGEDARVAPDIGVVDRVFPAAGQVEHLPVHAQAAHKRLAGIGQSVEVETDDLKATRQFILHLKGGRSEPFEQLFAPFILRPEQEHRVPSQSVHGVADCLSLGIFEGAGERCPEDLAAELVALEGDHLEIGGEALLDRFLKVGDQPVVAELEGHDHGEAQNFRSHRSVNVAGNEGAQGLRPGLGTGSAFGKVRLGEQEIGFEAQIGEFVGRLGEFAGGFEKGFAVFRIVVDGDELLVGAEEELKGQEAVGGVGMGLGEFLRIADHPFHGEALAGFRRTPLGLNHRLVEPGDGFL